jgi:ABC-2 type transport system ATP-binding protein
MIELEALSRTYGRKLAVDRLDLVLPRGELFAFLGANGAGKTTTIKMIVGLLRPTSGHVRICGFDMSTQGRSGCQRLGYVPDEPYLYEKLTGREFLHFIGGMHGLSRRETELRTGREIERFELADFVDDLAESYSHGMKQRLVFGSALLYDPAVLVIDEPMVGLDPRSVRIVKDLLKAESRRGVTIFMSTHTLAIAEEIADRIGIVSQGRLRCVGTLDELKRTLAVDHGSLERLFLDVTASKEPAAVAAGSVTSPVAE